MTNAHNMHNFFHCLKAIIMKPAQTSNTKDTLLYI